MNANPIINRPHLIESDPRPGAVDRNQGRRRWLARGAFGGTGLLVLFWTLYFARVISAAENPAIASFESAFWVADGLLAVMLVAGGVGLIRRKAYGLFCMVGAAAMTLYLGLLDLTFYVNQGFYSSLSADAVFQGVVTLCCLFGGGMGLLLGWKLWGAR